MRRVGCTNHCSACGTHFHSVAAFDAHRIGDFTSDDPDTRRRCAHPLDVVDRSGKPRYVELSEDGFCELYGPPQQDVCIWTLRAGLENARRAWGNVPEAQPLERSEAA